MWHVGQTSVAARRLPGLDFVFMFLRYFTTCSALGVCCFCVLRHVYEVLLSRLLLGLCRSSSISSHAAPVHYKGHRREAPVLRMEGNIPRVAWWFLGGRLWMTENTKPPCSMPASTIEHSLACPGRLKERKKKSCCIDPCSIAYFRSVPGTWHILLQNLQGTGNIGPSPCP